MRIFVPAVILTGVAMAVYLAVPATPPKQVETNGDRWKRICAVEASNTKRDQDDCVFKYAVGAAFEKSNADHKARLHDASR
jgi:hypothetical protein